MAWVDSATPPPANVIPDPCESNATKSKNTKFLFPNNPVYAYGDITFTPEIVSLTVDVPEQVVTFPPASFLLQDGSIAPIYPTYVGAFVYDLYLKKWGKAGHDYKRLFELFPINLQSGAIVPYEIFGSDTAILNPAGLIFIHDDTPLDSKITWGKVGYFRKGFTNAEEVILQFAKGSRGEIILEGSLDGKNLDPSVSYVQAFNANTLTATLYSKGSARWYNISVTGQFDITGLEFRGEVRGRR